MYTNWARTCGSEHQCMGGPRTDRPNRRKERRRTEATIQSRSIFCRNMLSSVALRLPQHDYLLRSNDLFREPRLRKKTAPSPSDRPTWESATVRMTRMSAPRDTPPHPMASYSSLAALAPLEAVLFDIDGTLCDSDPTHYYAFRDMLPEVGFNGGVPITEEFFMKNVSGKHNEELRHVLFPDWEIEKAREFFEDKEATFRRLASEKLEAMKGLDKLLQWIEDRGLKRAAVTNAPRPNADLILSSLGIKNFFQTLVIGNECERAKPFPDPYLKALQTLGVSPKHTFIFEDSVSGIKAGMAAGMQVVGLGTRNPEKMLAEAGAIFVIKDFLDPKLWTALEELEEHAPR